MTQDWLDAVDHLAAIQLECIGDIVVVKSEKKPDDIVCKPVENQFGSRIVDELGSRNESGTKYTIHAGLRHLAEKKNQILRSIGSIGHVNGRGAAAEVLQTAADGQSKAGAIGI